MLRSSRHQTLAGSVLVISSVLAFAGKAQAFTLIELEPTVVKVSTGDPVPASGPSQTANRPRYSVSDSGCDIVFTSDAKNLTPTQNDGNGTTDVFLYSLCGADPAMVLVSHQENLPDLTASGLSDQPVISSDGLFVVFRSTATDIVPGSGGRMNIYLWDRNTDKFTLVSHDFAKANQGGDGDSQNAVINRTPGGRPFVAFESLATNLLPPDGDTNGKSDVFRFRSEDGTIDLVSVPTVDRQADDGSFHPDIDATGNCIVYESLATNLVNNPAGDTNTALDVFRWKFPAEPTVTMLISHLPGSPDKAGDGESSEPSVDDGCKGYAFKSTVKDLALNQTDGNGVNDVFLSNDAGAGNLVTVLVSHGAGSPDKAGNDVCDSPIVSRDGNWVAYSSLATDLVSPQSDGAGTSDVFLYDVAGGKAVLVSHVAKDDSAATGGSLPEISIDGRYVAYVSGAKDLDPNQNDSNGDLDVFLYNRTWNNSIVVSRRYASIAITGRRRSYTPALSGRGYVVAFTSEANDLVADDPGAPGEPNVFFLITPFNIPILTARSTTNSNTIEWVAPAVNFTAMKAFFSVGACPATFGATVPANELALVGVKGNTRGQFTHGGLTPNTTYCYAIFTRKDDGSGFDPGSAPWETRTARTYIDATGRIQWTLNLADTTALTQVGIGTQSHVAVANDSGVYSFTRGPSGGFWSGSAWPFRVSAPIQGRPPIVGYGTLGSARTAFVGSQNGRAYAFDADRVAVAGGALWYSTPILGANGIQAGAAGMFTLFGGVADHILVGARTGGVASFFVLDAASGAQREAYTGGGLTIGAISTSASVDYAQKRVYFTSLDTGGPSLWCLNLTATGFGGECWPPSSIPTAVSGGPVQRNGKLYVGDDNGFVWAFDAAGGGVAWGPFFSCGASNPIRSYVLADRQGTQQDLFYSAGPHLCGVIDQGATAAPKWAPVTAAPNPSAPILARIGGVAYLYVGASDGRLYQIEAANPFATGAITSIVLPGASVVGPPAFDVVDSMIYVGSDAGVIYAVQAPLP